MRRSRGFTLVELMISLAIFALMVTLAYQSVDLLMDANRKVKEPQMAFQQLQRAVMFVERDMHQLVPRKRNNGYGQQEAALYRPKDEGVGVLLAFTRGGNPDVAWELRASGLMRSSLQRVRYVLDDGRLIRESWNLVDYAENTEPVSQVLLEGVKAVQFRFKPARDAEFRDDLPETGSKSPVAIEMTLEHEGFGNIKRIFLSYL